MPEHMKPIIGIAMTEPVDGSTPGIPDAMIRLLRERDIALLANFIGCLIDAEHPFSSDAFRAKLATRRIAIAKGFLLQFLQRHDVTRGVDHGDKKEA